MSVQKRKSIKNIGNRQKLKVNTVNLGARIVHQLADRMIIFTSVGASLFTFAIDPTVGVIILVTIIMLVPVYYVACEYFLQQTVGKMITGSVVINEFAERPTVGQCIGRTFARLVPFEQFSFLGSPSRGWHDEWSDTWVVSKAEAERIKAILDGREV